MDSVKFILTFLMVAAIVLFTGCEEKIFTSGVNCDECYSEKPDSVDLIFHLTINDEFPEVIVLLYEGNVDDGSFIDSLWCNNSTIYYWVKAEKKYSAKAIYSDTDRTVFVIDGIKQKLKGVSDACDEYCWVIENEDLYLQLVY